MLSEEQLRRYDTDGILPISKAQVQIADLAAALRDERKRVAELEADARLGKAFRVMRPEGQGYGWLIFKRTYASDAMWDQFIEAWEKAFQAALEAAQKEET